MRRRWMPWSVWAVCLILALVPLARPGADAGGAAPGSFRAAQETGLDLSLRPVDLLNLAPGSAPSGSFRAAQDIGTRGAWPGLYGERWSAEGYQGPGAPPPWAGGREQPLDSRPASERLARRTGSRRKGPRPPMFPPVRASSGFDER